MRRQARNADAAAATFSAAEIARSLRNPREIQRALILGEKTGGDRTPAGPTAVKLTADGSALRISAGIGYAKANISASASPL